jgi:hypothetical protein
LISVAIKGRELGGEDVAGLGLSARGDDAGGEIRRSRRDLGLALRRIELAHGVDDRLPQRHVRIHALAEICEHGGRRILAGPGLILLAGGGGADEDPRAAREEEPANAQCA